MNEHIATLYWSIAALAMFTGLSLIGLLTLDLWFIKRAQRKPRG